MGSPVHDAESSEWKTYWEGMADGCRRIQGYVAATDFESFRSDDKTYDAVVRNLEIIEHAWDSLPVVVRGRLQSGNRRDAVRFREVVANRFERDDVAEVWECATDQVPRLLDALQRADLDGLRAVSSAQRRRIGRDATAPQAIPWRGWRDICLRVWRQLDENNVFVVAAGVAFYALLSVFPALAALISIYGLWFETADVNQQFDALARLFPSQAWQIIRDYLSAVTQNPDITLSVSAIVGFMITLWSARAAMGAIMVAMNIVFGEREKRSLLAWYAWSIALTAAAIVYGVIALALIVALPALLESLGLDEQTGMTFVRWPFLAISTMLGLCIIYRYGPSRRRARWRWITWGAAGATAFWLVGSLLFSYYIANLANYDRTYGSVGAAVILMLWFYVTALIVLLGAEFDAEIEHQTMIDSTRGPPRPMGERGARMADTIGPRP